MSTISSRFGFSFLNTAPHLRSHGPARRGSRPGIGWVETLIQRSVQRRQLLETEDTQLMDMGISRADAEREARKPIWRA